MGCHVQNFVIHAQWWRWVSSKDQLQEYRQSWYPSNFKGERLVGHEAEGAWQGSKTAHLIVFPIWVWLKEVFPNLRCAVVYDEPPTHDRMWEIACRFIEAYPLDIDLTWIVPLNQFIAKSVTCPKPTAAMLETTEVQLEYMLAIPQYLLDSIKSKGLTQRRVAFQHYEAVKSSIQSRLAAQKLHGVGKSRFLVRAAGEDSERFHPTPIALPRQNPVLNCQAQMMAQVRIQRRRGSMRWVLKRS